MNASAGALALESQPFGWLRSAPAPARRALLAASVGWLFDGFDVMIYSMVLTALLADFGISKTTGGVLGSLTLLASAGGGVLFGMIADRYGRRTGLISSVLTYSLFTAACGLAQTVWQLAVCRFVLGLGMGGAWTTGAALVSETWPDRASRQSRRPHAERLGGRLRFGGCAGGDRAAPVRLAGDVLHRRAAGAGGGLDAQGPERVGDVDRCAHATAGRRLASSSHRPIGG